MKNQCSGKYASKKNEQMRQSLQFKGRQKAKIA